MVSQEGYIGARERFIEKVESVYGTAVSLTGAETPGVNLQVTPTFSQNFQEIMNNGGDVRTLTSKVAGPLSLAYSLQFSPIDWHMLKYVFDIDSETGTSPTTHTLLIGNTLMSFTSEWAMQHSTDPLIYLMDGNIITNFRIAFNKATSEGSDGFITCVANCIAQGYTTPASVTAGDFTDTGIPFQYRHSAAIINSVAVIPVNSGEIVFTQGINAGDSRYADTSLGREIGAPIATVFKISGRLNLNLFATTYSTLWEAAAALSGTNTIAFTQSASNKITFTFTNMYVSPVPHNGTAKEGVDTGDFVFTATSVAVVAVDGIANW